MKIPTAYRRFNRLLGPVFPNATGQLAARMFLTARPPRQSSPLAGAERAVDLGDGGCAWLFGKGPTVFLLHGWSSEPAVLGSLIPSLVAMGLQAVLIRAPGHDPAKPGVSHPGAFIEALLRARDKFGVPAAVVGHSMGAASALVAQSEGLRAGCIVLVSSPAHISGVLDRFIRDAELPAGAARHFRSRVEQVVGKSEGFFDSQRFARGIDGPVLLVHDRDDTEIPFEEARLLNARLPNSRLYMTFALGHRRILKDSGVLSEIAAFLGHYAKTSRVPPPAALQEPARPSLSLTR